MACQLGPVAISTASMSLRSSSSRKSRYMSQSLLPYCSSAIFLTASRRAAFTSHTATNCTSFCSRKQPRSYVPRLPMPMPPTTIRSLGGTAPSRPKAELGMIVGATAAAAPAESAVFKNPRRWTRCFALLDMAALLNLLGSFHPAQIPPGGVVNRKMVTSPSVHSITPPSERFHRAENPVFTPRRRRSAP